MTTSVFVSAPGISARSTRTRRAVDTLYVLNTGLFRSVDGGKTFNLLPARHGDHHGLWIDPKDPQPDRERQRRRRERLDRWRRDLVDAEQPADRAVLSRRGGQRVSLSHLRRATGQLERRHREPRRERRDRARRLVPGRAAASAASSFPIRATGTSFIPTTRASSRATTKRRSNTRTSASGRSITPVMARSI